MIFSIEKVADIWNELVPNLYEFYIETGMSEQGEFIPSLPLYKRYEDVGAFVLFTARDDSRLVGHCGMFLTPSMYSHTLVATEDGFFVKKEYRRSSFPLTAYRFIETQLRGLRVNQIVVTTHLNISRVMDRLGYQKVGSRYSKFL